MVEITLHHFLNDVRSRMSSRPEVEVSIGIDISAVVAQRDILKRINSIYYITQCLKITEKGLIQHYELSKQRLHFEWTKVN